MNRLEQAIIKPVISFIATLFKNSGSKPDYTTESSSPSGSLNVRRYKDCPVRHFFGVDDKFFRWAQPGSYPDGTINKEKMGNEIRYIRDQLGVDTIISFRKPPKDGEIIKVEADVIAKLNRESPDKPVRFLNLAVEITSGLSQEEAKEIYEIISSQEPTMFVHCRDGRDRTGAATVFRRMAMDGSVGFDDLIAEMVHCGNDPLNGLWGTALCLGYVVKHYPIFQSYYKGHNEKVDTFADICALPDDRVKHKALLRVLWWRLTLLDLIRLSGASIWNILRKECQRWPR